MGADGINVMDAEKHLAKRAKALSDLRMWIEWLEANPSVELPAAITTLEYCSSAEEIAKRAREMGGTWQKVESDGYFELHRHFGPARHEMFVSREAVCEAVVVGKETVRIEEPDPDAPRITRTVTRAVIEWRCPELLRPTPPDDQ